MLKRKSLTAQPAHPPSIGEAAGLSLHQLLSRFAPFNRLSDKTLETLPVRKVICKRNMVLNISKSHLYLVVQGEGRELVEGHRGREAYVSTYGVGDIIGWWSADGLIKHDKATHYLVISVQPTDIPELRLLRVQAMHQHIVALTRRLAVFMTTSVSERIELEDLRAGETRTAMAKRIGCSREYISKLIRQRHAERA